MMQYVFNIFSSFTNDECSSSKQSQMVSMCLIYDIKQVWFYNKNRRFKSSRPDQQKQWITVYAVAYFLFGLALGQQMMPKSD